MIVQNTEDAAGDFVAADGCEAQGKLLSVHLCFKPAGLWFQGGRKIQIGPIHQIVEKADIIFMGPDSPDSSVDPHFDITAVFLNIQVNIRDMVLQGEP